MWVPCLEREAIAMKDVRNQINNPDNKGLTLEQRELATKASVNSCDDNIRVYVEINDNKVELARFDGEGCSISMASTDIMLGEIEGLEVEQARELVERYEKFVNNEIQTTGNENLDQFNIVHTHVSRIKCASIVIGPLKELIK